MAPNPCSDVALPGLPHSNKVVYGTEALKTI